MMDCNLDMKSCLQSKANKLVNAFLYIFAVRKKNQSPAKKKKTAKKNHFCGDKEQGEETNEKSMINELHAQALFALKSELKQTKEKCQHN